MSPSQAREIHHSEVEVTKLFLHGSDIFRLQRLPDLLQLLGHLVPGPAGVIPVKSHTADPVLDTVSLEEGVQATRQTVQNPASWVPFPRLERLPLLLLPQPEEVGVAAHHLL